MDNMTLASILGVPGNNGICGYIKEVWQESKYIKPLEIRKKFSNDESITAERRVKSTEMKSFQRFLHFVVMKIMVPRFGKRDTTSFMDLTYMDHLLTRRLVNLPRRRDDEEEIPAENVENEEAANEGEEVHQDDIDWEAVNEEDEIQGESGSAEKFYDVEDEVQGSAGMIEQVSEVIARVSVQQKETAASGVDPSTPTGSIPDSIFLSLQAELERARVDRIQVELDRAQAENARLLALLQQAKSQPKP
ncbi:hypothetical protein Dimus_021945 [Dionaea muscipula]